jgi:putative salt-induced outer membrane protein YdiY
LRQAPATHGSERNGTESDFATLRLAEKFEWKFSPTTRFWQSVSITPEVGDFGKYLLDFEAGIETRISSSWSLRTFVRHRIDSDPSPGKGRSDTALILGLAYELGGLPEPEESGGRRSLIPGEEGGGDDSKGWVSTAALGFSLNKGNSDSTGLNLACNTAFRSAEREFFFDLAQTLRENNGATSEDRTISRVHYNRFRDKRLYLGATVGFLRDGQADIDYRITPGFLVGYALIKNGTTDLSFEAGPGYTLESRGGVDKSYASLIAAERFLHKFNDRLTLVQSIEVTSELADFGNHSFLASPGLDTKISDRLIWKTAATYTYESRPSAARVHHDTALTSAIALRFWGGGQSLPGSFPFAFPGKKGMMVV